MISKPRTLVAANLNGVTVYNIYIKYIYGSVDIATVNRHCPNGSPC